MARVSKQIGIYRLTNLIDFKTYIGSSVNISNRKSRHKCLLKQGTHDNKHMQRSYNKYGNVFIFEILELCDKEILLNREQHYITEYNPEYNVVRNIHQIYIQKTQTVTDKTREAWKIAQRKNVKNYVYQYDLQNNLLNIFETVTDAANSIGKSIGNIAKCARSKEKKIMYGYKWDYIPKNI